MNQAYARLKKRIKKLNIHSVTFEEGLKICRRERIGVYVYAMADDVKGYYSNVLVKKYRKKIIVINEKLSPLERWFVLLHELIHHFLHRSNVKRQVMYCRANELIESREELEAKVFTLMLMYPTQKFIEIAGENNEHLSEVEQDYLIQRNWVFQNHRNLERL